MRTFYKVFVIILLLYGFSTYYVGARGSQAFGHIIPFFRSWYYWVVLFVLSLSYLVGRFASSYLPRIVGDVLAFIGSWWWACFFYLILILAVINLIRLLNYWLGFIPVTLIDNPHYTGFAVVGFVLLLVAAGAWNAHHPRITSYSLAIEKKSPLKELHIVAVSDIHLGTIIHNDRLSKLVDSINAQNPDLILFGGDTIDESVQTFIEQNMEETLKRLHPRYGSYAVFGNHEYISRYTDATAGYLKDAGITVLRDETVKVADSFYIAGRDEHSRGRVSGIRRRSLEDMLKDADHSLPIIVMSHQPTNFPEAETAGADLQFSGHTHHGQLWPINYITRAVFETDYGYLKKGQLNVIVSSGYGTWGPPIRLGNRPEIVDIKISFAAK
ncbi:MAG: metallophosphoesterase [Candidatus Saccharibacteria bacterium]